MATSTAREEGLKRAIGLWPAVLYGLGVTIGAGIYVLIGATAGRAGFNAPVAFILAALVMAPTAASFAEFAGRLPVSAGEAAYVREGLGSRALALLVGIFVAVVGIVSSAAIAQGCAGYLQELVRLDQTTLLVIVVLLMGLVAAWGVSESIAMAGIMTLIEVGGLLTIVAIGTWHEPAMMTRLPEMVPATTDTLAWSGVLAATMLAFFAFIGFESLANLAEEVKQPERTLPLAIFITLGVSTLLYILVVWVALNAVPRIELAASNAPLSLVFQRVTGASPTLITLIAIIATANGIIVQIIMASRVIYGLASRGQLPRVLAYVDKRTHTPLLSTGIVTALVLWLGVGFGLSGLAIFTSIVTLIVFALVNLALVRLKLRGDPPPAGSFTVPVWIPASGALLCTGLLVVELVR